MAHIGRRAADDAGAPMTAAYGADGHSHQRASSAEGSESQGGRSSAMVRERLFQGITVDRKGLTPFPCRGCNELSPDVRPLRMDPDGLG